MQSDSESPSGSDEESLYIECTGCVRVINVGAGDDKGREMMTGVQGYRENPRVYALHPVSCWHSGSPDQTGVMPVPIMSGWMKSNALRRPRYRLQFKHLSCSHT